MSSKLEVRVSRGVGGQRVLEVHGATTRALEYFEQNGGTGASATMVGDMLDAVVACIGCYGDAQSSQRERSEVLELLLRMESRREADKDQLIGAMSDAASGVRGAVVDEAARVASAVSVAVEQQRKAAEEQALVLESTLRGALEQMNVEALSGRVASVLRPMLCEDVRAGQGAMQAGMVEFENRLRGDMTAMLVTPLAERHAALAKVLESLPSGLCAAVVMANASPEKDVSGQLRRLGELGQQTQDALRVLGDLAARHGAAVEGVASQLREHVRSMLEGEGTHGVEGKSERAAQVEQVVSAAVGVLVKKVQENGAAMLAKVEGACRQLKVVEESMGVSKDRLLLVRESGESVVKKVDELTKMVVEQGVRQTSHNRAKGVAGESGLQEVLSEVLSFKEGYSVRVVSGKAHGCDLVVSRTGHTDVRIESKVYAGKVPTAEVEKFRRDLEGLNVHGVFVSLTSGIVGLTSEAGGFERMSNGKCAVYLPNNNYNGALIRDWVEMIHKWDSGRASEGGEGAGESGVVRVPCDVMKEVHKLMRDIGESTDKLITSAKQDLELLKRMKADQLAHVERLLRGGLAPAAAARPVGAGSPSAVASRQSSCAASAVSASSRGKSSKQSAARRVQAEAAAYMKAHLAKP